MVQPITSSSTESISHSMPLLEFDKIGLEYPFGDSIRRIIQEISLSINLGEFVSFVGPSGCGKTSILRMVSGLSPTKIGELRCHGQPVIKPLKNVGIAFQNPVLLPWRRTIDNVLLPLEVVHPYKRDFKVNHAHYVGMAQKLLQAVGLKDFQQQFPWQLSGGMRQRASLCRSLIHQPEILLLDEPFGALDAFTREEMWVMLQDLWMQAKCVGILITHDLRESVFLSDKVYVMSPRPSEIAFELEIDLPRPRTLEMCLSDEFAHLAAELRRHIHKN
ncbi:MAG: ABC transporter ATP-binding protein [Pseudanabaena sp. M158S2SP1A06QC]|nr:ABC transporter ATP-binding protein [Pseudanabaena sp. M090S1SP2A07QC]MCA6562082.1 ABC transporter ATP-binding protein [Pseudanabaena sp. M079S1SP2A07QC]MCA6574279.1 ABC transporter ATP-binding protein [Pseudanabaena sp. M53BS1SP1A06MG]MCA6581978.1 ABC transporter ATP-binding protein [Pseudanabaena sp. M34BS1SP1A06MG]MCA6591234.1 ABC transporter ATP-binding protein [Pseudanabaena sp. M38BS1SP1A06MG]MCA6598069.1 ABC transporter ATP-binding protein [Pseudanabaena sp. M046S1SP1A06QC]MCA660204